MQFTQETTVYPAESVDSKMEYVDLGRLYTCQRYKHLCDTRNGYPRGHEVYKYHAYDSHEPDSNHDRLSSIHATWLNG